MALKKEIPYPPGILKKESNLSYTLKELAEKIGGKVIGDETLRIKRINSLQEARDNEISFFTDNRYRNELINTRAGALIASQVTEGFQGSLIIASNPNLAYAKITALFAKPPAKFSGLSDKAFIHETSEIGEDVSIHPMAYIGREVVIENGVTIYAGVFLGDNVRIGRNTIIYPNVSIMHGCIIGHDVIIHAGTVIGSDGFGFVQDGKKHLKIPQIGMVQIDDQVEIGANNCIDRAAFGKTWIKRGVKTDNLVQIGHNVVIGENSIVVSQAGISGSVQIGREVLIGGQVGLMDHISIGDGAMIGAGSGLYKSIEPGTIVSGTPAMPHRQWLKTLNVIPQLPRMLDRIRKLEKKIRQIEKGT